MSLEAKLFLEKSAEKSNDRFHFSKLYNNISKYDIAVANGKKAFADMESIKSYAHQLKKKAIYHLDSYLLEFEKHFTHNGGEVLWATDANEAQQHVLKICQQFSAQSVVKGKSMISEELHLNDFLAKHHIEAVETDLGEFIQQLDGEPPYHILTPAMHKSKEEIAKLFHEKLGTEPNLPPEQLTMIAREKLREKFRQAEVGITGANFILPDIGGIALTENEGNIRLSFGFPKVHIAIVGIEKVIPSFEDLSTFWQLLALHGTGQKMTSYNSIITGPKKGNENQGPEKMFVILLDNKRTELMKNEKLIQSMFCIRCGACLNICPIYKNIGGIAYGTTYSGPIGSVITPHLKGMDKFGHLSFASSLCGSCTEVCPVKIDLHGLLLQNRILYNKAKVFNPKKWIWKMWSFGMRHKEILSLIPLKYKNALLEKWFPNWSAKRSKLYFSKWNAEQLNKEINLTNPKKKHE